MSTNVLLILVGATLFLAGLAKLGRSQSGGFNLRYLLRNVGINFGGTVTQINIGDKVTPDASKETPTDWVGLIIAVLGLFTAIVGWLKG